MRMFDEVAEMVKGKGTLGYVDCRYVFSQRDCMQISNKNANVSLSGNEHMAL